MGATGRDPLQFELGDLRRSMDRAFEEMLLRSPRRSVPLMSATKRKPPVEVFVMQNEVVVRIEHPDADPKAMDVTVREDVVALGGDAKREEARKERT